MTNIVLTINIADLPDGGLHIGVTPDQEQDIDPESPATLIAGALISAIEAWAARNGPPRSLQHGRSLQ